MSETTDTALLEAAIVRAITPALQQLEQRLGDRIDGAERRLSARIDAVEARMSGVALAGQQLFRELSERMARLESRVESLTAAVGNVAGKLLAFELDLAEIKGRLDRISTDITRGFTVDADRYAELVKRVEALEARLHG